MIALIKDLEAENFRLKKIYKEEKLKVEVFNELITKKW